MENIAKKYGLDLNQGRHPNEYHKFVLNKMQIIDEMPNMNQMEFINQFEQRIKVPIRTNPNMLYKKYWQLNAQ